MPPKPKDNKPGKIYRPNALLKDIIPANIKVAPREGKTVLPVEPSPHEVDFKLQPHPVPDDWPGDDAALDYNFNIEGTETYVDRTELLLPPSLEATGLMTFWRRPREFMKDENTEPVPSQFAGRGDERLVHAFAKGFNNRFMRSGTIAEGVIRNIMEPLDDIAVESPTLKKIRQEEMNLNLIVIDTTEREETPEEVVQRIKIATEKAAASKKKATKKEKDENLDDKPQKVKEGKLNNMDMRGHFPPFFIWIASQFQIIRDRQMKDVNTGEPIWKKIYPQREGVPVINQSGKYWVKLYFMGKLRKVEIDDNMPVTSSSTSVIPRTTNRNEIWPLILTKALLKLMNWKFLPEVNAPECGDAGVIYALTGFQSQTIPVNRMTNETWKTVNDLLSDENFENRSVFATTFCRPSHKPVVPSNTVKNADDAIQTLLETKLNTQEEEDKLEAAGGSLSATGRGRMSLSINTGGGGGSMFKALIKEKPSYIIPGFAYSIVDSFQNENFNMAYVQKKSDREIKLRMDYLNLLKTDYRKMNKEEKIEFRKVKKDVKEKLKEEDNKRSELLNKQAIQHKLLKIRSGVDRVPVLNINAPFRVEEINAAKRLILNKLSKPPNYDLYDFKVEEKSAYSQAVPVINVDAAVNMLTKDPEDFKIENGLEPVKRPLGGAWIADRDFLSAFEYIQLYFDPQKFKKRDTFLFTPNPEEEQISLENKEIIVIEEEESKKNSSFTSNSRQHQPEEKPIRFHLGFTSAVPINAQLDPAPYVSLNRFDFHNFEAAYTYPKIENSLNGMYLALENKNQVFRVSTYTPLSFVMWLSVDANYQTMTVSEYLTKYEGFTSKPMNVDYPPMEKNKYSVIYKMKLATKEENSMVVLKSKLKNNLYLTKYLRLKLIQRHDNETLREEEEFEGVHYHKHEQTLTLFEYTKLNIQAGYTYTLILECRPLNNVADGSIELEFYTKSPDVLVENMEMVEPQEFSDKYNINKYGILFRERFFVNAPTNLSCHVRLIDMKPIGAPVDPKAAAKAAPKKGAEVPQYEEGPVQKQCLMHLELIENDQKTVWTSAYNDTLLSEVYLEPTNQPSKPTEYIIQGRLDLRELPDAIQENEYTKTLGWVMRIFTNNTVGIVRDTKKEDREREIEKSWEDSEPGRAEKAKKNRAKFLLKQKLDAGGQLTEAELALVNEARVPKKLRVEETAQKGGKGAPKKASNVPPTKGTKKEEPVEEKPKERPLPKSEDHTMFEIKEFLQHLESNRVKELHPLHGGFVGKRTEDSRQAIEEGAKLAQEERVGMFVRNITIRENLKLLLKDTKEATLKELDEQRKQFLENAQGLLKERSEIRNRLNDKNEKEKKLLELCMQDSTEYEKIQTLMKEVETTEEADTALLDIAQKAYVNAYIKSHIEKLNQTFAVLDITNMTNLLNELREKKVPIPTEMEEKAEMLIDESINNPQAFADRVKEAMKANKGKPGKK